jgi:putative transcriptional regulator
MKIKRTRRGPAKGSFLEGQLLIAMPTMTDKRFARSVIYLCAHSEEGAMGLIVNQRADNVTFPDLMRQLGIVGAEQEAAVPDAMQAMAVHVGGPVEKGRGFVLHSADYVARGSTLEIGGGVCLTATMDILKAIAAGKGPGRAILALGYSGWAPGQLETEIQANGWLHCTADEDLVFGQALEEKWPSALTKIGIDLSHLVSEAGHA